MSYPSFAEVLGRVPLEELNLLAGPSAVELLSRLSGKADSQSVANLILGQLTAAGALRSAEIRASVLAQLTGLESESLCREMELPPGATILPAAFARNRTLERVLFAFLGVDYPEIDRSDPPASRLVSPSDTLSPSDMKAFHELRSLVGRRSQDVLLRMPMGSGKIRMITRLVTDLLRSSMDGDIAVWLTDGVRYCEDIFHELEATWKKIGNRDLTIFRAYGPNRSPTLQGLKNSIVVADVASFPLMLTSDAQIENVASRLRCIVLSDAAYVFDKTLSDLIDKLSLAGAGNLIGMSTSLNAPTDDRRTASLERRFTQIVESADTFSSPLIQIDLSNNLDVSVFETGYQGQIDLGRFDVSKASLEALERDVDRSAKLIELIQKEVFAGSAVAFHAVSAGQAHAFAGVLAHRSTFASAITSRMSQGQQLQTATEFNIQSRTMVICLEDIPLLENEMKRPTTLILGCPTSSFSKFSASVGRFLSKLDPDVALKVIVVDDGFEPFSGMAKQIQASSDRETLT